VLLTAIDAAGDRRLPHQIQRIIRVTRKYNHQDLNHHAHGVLAGTCSRPVLDDASSPDALHRP
jgi:hypothetical protein